MAPSVIMFIFCIKLAEGSLERVSLESSKEGWHMYAGGLRLALILLLMLGAALTTLLILYKSWWVRKLMICLLRTLTRQRLYRRQLKAITKEAHKRTYVEKVMLIFIESGLLYFFYYTGDTSFHTIILNRCWLLLSVASAINYWSWRYINRNSARLH